jgi:spore germination protein GerM
MEKNEKIFLAITAVIMVVMLCFVGLKTVNTRVESPFAGPEPGGVEIPQDVPEGEEVTEQTPETKPEEPKKKVYINVFFIGQNENKEEVYKAVKREYDKGVDGSQIRFAIKTLVAGPKPSELEKGVYSEIPSTTYLISVNEQPDRVTINLNSGFTSGGGTDSLYKRLYQLIKTAKNNTDKPIYLQINSKQAEVIGGEGIMLTQPLTEDSLGG